MMDKIIITKTAQNLPIGEGFELIDMKGLNVIVGKNNSGKTRFFKSIEKLYEKSSNLRVVYIPASEVRPEDDYYKSSIGTSSLIKIISALFGENIKLDKSINVAEDIRGFVVEVENKFREVCNEDPCGLNIKLEEKLKKDEVVKSMIASITTNLSDEKGKLIKLGDIGQGYQRMFIASMIQAYAERQVSAQQKNILILFEEPELFLHPEMKKGLNKALKEIAGRDNHQVIISTHDPYFLWSNMDDDDVQTYSFKIGDDGKTEVSTTSVGFGVEDEMLHISLFSKMIELMKQKSIACGLGVKSGDSMEDTSNHLTKLLDEQPTTKKYKHGSEYFNVVLPIYVRNKIHHPENAVNPDYTPEELVKSIEDLNRILLELPK